MEEAMFVRKAIAICFLLTVVGGEDDLYWEAVDLTNWLRLEDIVDGTYLTSPGEGRFFGIERGLSYNASVAFTIPFFHFHIPYDKTSPTGLSQSSFGILGFVSLAIITGILIALYSTHGTQSLLPPVQGRVLVDDLSTMTSDLYDALTRVPDLLGTDTCLKLAVCSAHAQSDRHDDIDSSIRFLFPLAPEDDLEVDSNYTEAGSFGAEQGIDECLYRYPCIVQPLDLASLLIECIQDLLPAAGDVLAVWQENTLF